MNRLVWFITTNKDRIAIRPDAVEVIVESKEGTLIALLSGLTYTVTMDLETTFQMINQK